MYENEKTFDVTKMVYTGNNRIEFGDRSAILTGLRICAISGFQQTVLRSKTDVERSKRTSNLKIYLISRLLLKSA